MMDRIGDGFRGTGALPDWGVVKVEHILYGLVIVSSRFKMIREANVHAAIAQFVINSNSPLSLATHPGLHAVVLASVSINANTY